MCVCAAACREAGPSHVITVANTHLLETVNRRTGGKKIATECTEEKVGRREGSERKRGGRVREREKKVRV